MARVKLYGNNIFTPTDLPAGVTLERGPLLAVWAGCLGVPCCTDINGNQSDGDYDTWTWRTKTEWSYGGYFSGNLSGCGSDCRDCNAAALLCDGNGNTGLDQFLNNNNSNKRCIVGIQRDIDPKTPVSYVRIWVMSAATKPMLWLRPYYQFTSGGDQNDKGLNVDGPNTGYFYCDPNTGNTPQKSIKLTAAAWFARNPFAALTMGIVQDTAWGTRFALRGGDTLLGLTSGPGDGNFHIGEIGVEVGFDTSTGYEVKTVSATATPTTATLAGTVNPNGDAGGKNFFQFGTSIALGSSTTEILNTVTSQFDSSALITGLTVNKLYYYRAVARTSSGDLVYGEILTFFTASACSTRTSLVGG